MTDLANWLILQQDLGWLTVATAWSVVALLWWRTRPIGPAGRWIPWTAAAAVAISVLELSLLLTPQRVAPHLQSRLAWEIGLSLVTALQAAGWFVAALSPATGKRARVFLLGLFGLLGVWVALRMAEPRLSSLALAFAAGGAALALGTRLREHRWEIAALVLAALALALSTAGPASEFTHWPRRSTDFSPLAPWAIALHLGAAVCILNRQVQIRLINAGEGRAELRNDLQLLSRWLLVWFAIGFVLIALMGRMARRYYEQSVRSRVEIAALQVDVDRVEEVVGPRLRIDRYENYVSREGARLQRGISTYLAGGIAKPLERTLSAIERANPDAAWATITTVRDGWYAVVVASDAVPRKRGLVALLHPVAPKDLAAWNSTETDVGGPYFLFYGIYLEARAPLRSRSGQMLGWLMLDFSAAHWVAAQAQARLEGFVAVALGGCLLLLIWLQRLDFRQRSTIVQAAETARAASQIKTAFLAKVSHELRTPLQSILGYGELIESANLTAETRRWLGALRQHGGLMVRLVNDLIDLSALEAGAFRLIEQPLELAPLVGQTVASLQPAARGKDLACVFIANSGVPPWVLGDAERLRQIVTNLVSNAIKFTESGSITVTLGHDPAQGWVTLQVTDTGPGIPPEARSRLFAPFSRLPGAAGKEGSGLGLALTAGLCQSMHGALDFVSDGHSGTTFCARLRLPPCPAPVNAVPETPLLSGKRVLVVDDNELVRTLLVTYLEVQGATCAAEMAGRPALQRAISEPFDILVIDLALPDISGRDVTAALRARPDGARHLRIVGVSAHADPVEQAKSLRAGMDAFLVKPLQLDKLARAMAGGGEPARPLPDGDLSHSMRKLLANRFRELAPEQAQAVARACGAADWPAVRQHAHTLKNSAAVVGDDDLFSACAVLEDAAVGLDPLMAERAWAACRRALERWISP